MMLAIQKINKLGTKIVYESPIWPKTASLEFDVLTLECHNLGENASFLEVVKIVRKFVYTLLRRSLFVTP